MTKNLQNFRYCYYTINKVASSLSMSCDYEAMKFHFIFFKYKSTHLGLVTLYPSYCTLKYYSGFIFYTVIDNSTDVYNATAILHYCCLVIGPISH